ncbi:Pet122p NDAI_0C05970 [Naumovozyma dairenensis CBS 421]|uniref:Uncharacterized protein n=1 Tax=Naumovozyma dairenensis (strain ATCC 10597 / BCRC 20456 / CBS 421 / NBRC 0211 / NRRL Y-12639) TaxID=1071378 RepID=G0W8Z5_NAUDC|nr:hypothetical protein NDAI_0C05970 [Naumovozyma dairenensis CBS 421]CCD24256.1 hypothetical protein NDAI_0C05970 [Naumovozyma dairenensis CBS 421]
MIRNISGSRRYINDDARKRLFLNCLNRNFDQVLTEVRGIPRDEMDSNFLQLYLIKSCQWGHMDSIEYIWYKYVTQWKALTVPPKLLCDIGNICISYNKTYIPKQLYAYFNAVYGKRDNKSLRSKTEDHYALLRIRVESFAKGTLHTTKFREKWKVYLEDIDNNPYFNDVTNNHLIKVRDFPYLTQSMNHSCDEETASNILFGENRIAIKNPRSLILFLNMILLQDGTIFSTSFKTSVLKRFQQVYQSMELPNDTLTILKTLSRQ